MSNPIRDLSDGSAGVGITEVLLERTHATYWKGARGEAGAAENAERRIPAELGQIVLVLQGGGALGAYQAGVYQALHEAGVEPDWVIGTSIGAINAKSHRRQRRGGPAAAAQGILEPGRARATSQGHGVGAGVRSPARELDDRDRWHRGLLRPSLACLHRIPCASWR